MKILSIVITLLIFCISSLSAVDLADEIKLKEKELADLDKELSQSKKKTEEFAIQEGNILDELTKLTVKINNLQTEKKNRESELRQLNNDLTKLTGKAQDLGKEKEDLRRLMGLIIASSFKNSKIRDLETFMPESAMKSMSESTLMASVGEYNYYLIVRTGQVLDEVTTVMTVTKEKQGRVQLAYLNAKIAEKKLDALQKKHTKALETIRSQKTHYTGLIQELEKRKEAMTGLLKELEKQIAQEKLLAQKDPNTKKINDATKKNTTITITKNGQFGTLKKKLPWPVQGRIYTPYGKIVNQRYNTTLFNDGIDILANAYEPVIAVASGTVVFAKLYKSFGNTVIIDHGDGYFTIYANLASLVVNAGDSVDGGSRVGTVGADVVTGLPLLHFEIRKGTQAYPPNEWLK